MDSRDRLIQTRLTKGEADRLKLLSQLRGKSQAEFLREAVISELSARFVDLWTLPREAQEKELRLRALREHRIIPDCRLRIRRESFEAIEGVLFVEEGSGWIPARREHMVRHSSLQRPDLLDVVLHGGLWTLQRFGVEHAQLSGRTEETEVIVVFLRFAKSLDPTRP